MFRSKSCGGEREACLAYGREIRGAYKEYVLKAFFSNFAIFPGFVARDLTSTVLALLNNCYFIF